jgi:hypothetical protein
VTAISYRYRANFKSVRGRDAGPPPPSATDLPCYAGAGCVDLEFSMPVRVFSTWRDRLREIAAEPWGPVSAATACAVLAGGAWMIWQALAGNRWVPLLDNANLVFHEAGHVVLGLVSNRLAVYGGTLGQLVFPVAVTLTFWRRREPAACALGAFWFCESCLNIATYMGDARALQLPLIGGLDPEVAHDWREILGRFGLLAWDQRLAGVLRFFTVLAAVVTAGWLLLRWRSASR